MSASDLHRLNHPVRLHHGLRFHTSFRWFAFVRNWLAMWKWIGGFWDRCPERLGLEIISTNSREVATSLRYFPGSLKVTTLWILDVLVNYKY
jgi:hypothetical protein